MWVFSPPATQDCLLLQQTLRGSFLTHAATVLGEDSAELRILSRAVECVLRALAALLQALLLLNLAAASVSIASARSVTSSYRMTNKPCGSVESR